MVKKNEKKDVVGLLLEIRNMLVLFRKQDLEMKIKDAEFKMKQVKRGFIFKSFMMLIGMFFYVLGFVALKNNNSLFCFGMLLIGTIYTCTSALLRLD